MPRDEVAAALEPADVDEAVSAGLLTDRDGQVSAALDLRPHGDAAVPDAAPWWVLSDLEVDPAGRTADREHVLGTGAASLSLARATVRRPVDTLLDVGTGCGVQVLHCSGHARRMTATDVSTRALDMARVTLALSGVDAELLDGPWLEPVAGRRFDQIVSNPPFVPGPPQVDHVYRDSGLGGDGASALLVGRLPGFLTEGGVAQLLASWLITSDDWTERPRTWLAEAADAAAPGGLDAWVVQRDVADPALHVGTWLRDAGVDPASPEGTALSERWLDFLDGEGVHAIGFGFVTLRRTAPDVAGTVVCEDLRQSHDDPLGPEIEAWLDRTAWLARHPGEALLDTRPRVPDDRRPRARPRPHRRGLVGGGGDAGAPRRPAVAPRRRRAGRRPAGRVPRVPAAARPPRAARARPRPRRRRARRGHPARRPGSVPARDAGVRVRATCGPS